MSEEITITGKWNIQELDSIIDEFKLIDEPDKRIALLSEHFLGTQYKANTLIGAADKDEVFVINLESVDCLTFIEYIEAMRLSDSFSAFKITLRSIRYQGAVVDYCKRNHFFTDWREFNAKFVQDITSLTGGSKTAHIQKMLNLKNDGTYLLPGIAPRLREIRYIPSAFIDDKIIDSLKTGDYIGIYSEKPGLDVSHVGILIKNVGQTLFRHASFVHKKVVDEDFNQYIMTRPGILVLRPLHKI